MSDFFEIDFLDVESTKSGDAIPIRYRINDLTYIHVTDGGFQDTGDSVVEHIRTHYDDPLYIDNVIVSHPDGDHAAGLRAVLEQYRVGQLWMLRPWLYAEYLLPHFPRFSSSANLAARLREAYPNITALEEIAIDKDIPMREPFQGARIGAFSVLAPSKRTYLRLVLESDKTPEPTTNLLARSAGWKLAEALISLVRAGWGKETFPGDDTTPENNMSVVQYANLCGKKILLTADAGRLALEEAAQYAPSVGLILPGVDKIQIPHHGSRHNVSTDLLDRWLGPRSRSRPNDGEETFEAIVSAAKRDKDHPRKAVIRGFIHRGARVLTTQGASIRINSNAPSRAGWEPATPLPYPDYEEK
jgi:hypothetical protein